MDFAEEIRDFLIESNENLAALDQQIVELEKNPTDEKLIASVFRTIHTVKGTSGFFGFKVLGSIAHVAENILGQVREKQRPLTPELVSLVLQTMDAIRAVLDNVEANGAEGEDVYQELRARLDDAYHYRGAPAEMSAALVEAAHLETVAAENRAAEAAASETDAPAQAAIRNKNESPMVTLADVEEIRVAAPVIAEPRQRDGDSPAAGVETYGRRADDGGAANSTIRVDVSLLDKLMNLVGELVLARNQILQGPESGNSSGTAQRLNLITSELQEGVMRTRMQPIGMVWNKLPRVVRDLASSLGKKIEIQMEGAETELDKTIIEAIKDPLTHIVRNSCDHGIESPEARLAKGKSAQGTILLRAFHEGGHVNIEISDDGAGIDPEKIKAKAVQKGLIRAEQAATINEWEALRLIFLPGFSTAEAITSISGRGVGMDVVKTNIEKISGSVDLSNRVGAGSTIKIKIPLTLAIIPGLIVSLRGSLKGSEHHCADASDSGEASPAYQPDQRQPDQRFVIPQANLLELVRLEGEKDRKQIETIHGAEVYRRRGKLLPLAYLSQVLGLPSDHPRDPLGIMNIVVVQAEETAFGLVVDQVNDTQEIVVKALGKQLKALSCYVGATIMGDGKIALILDVTGIAKLAHLLAQPLKRGRAEGRPAAETVEKKQMLLLFRSGKFPRLVSRLSDRICGRCAGAALSRRYFAPDLVEQPARC
jgi:two-component system chemotaxis sensor kinase CheA